MQWLDLIKEPIASAILIKDEKINLFSKSRIFHLIDLTSLNDSDTESSINMVCEKALTRLGHVAAFCTSLRFTKLVATHFEGTPVKVATVANFPHGTASLEETLFEISQALRDGAEEIDVVFPYQAHLTGEDQHVHTFITACKAVCGEKVKLKVILETGALKTLDVIAAVSKEALMAGADFIKTSTGKISQGATLEAAATMLLVLRDFHKYSQREVGIKVSGGIKTPEQAQQYIQLAENIMGSGWVQPSTFRIGASKLVDELLNK